MGWSNRKIKFILEEQKILFSYLFKIKKIRVLCGKRSVSCSPFKVIVGLDKLFQFLITLYLCISLLKESN